MARRIDFARRNCPRPERSGPLHASPATLRPSCRVLICPNLSAFWPGIDSALVPGHDVNSPPANFFFVSPPSTSTVRFVSLANFFLGALHDFAAVFVLMSKHPVGCASPFDAAAGRKFHENLGTFRRRFGYSKACVDRVSLLITPSSCRCCSGRFSRRTTCTRDTGKGRPDRRVVARVELYTGRSLVEPNRLGYTIGIRDFLPVLASDERPHTHSVRD